MARFRIQWGIGPVLEQTLETSMPRLFANPSRFIQDAIEQAKMLNIAGYNLDFEATGEAPNVDHATWLRCFASLIHLKGRCLRSVVKGRLGPFKDGGDSGNAPNRFGHT